MGDWEGLEEQIKKQKGWDYMSYLDGFVLYKPSTPIRPPRGQMRVTIAGGQITFSKELVVALGSPKQVNLYQDKDGRRIALKATTRGGLRFAGGGSRGRKGKKDAKVIWKEPEVLSLFHAYVEPLKLGTYYCVGAEIEDGVAMFDMNAASRYETDGKTLEKLRNSRKKEA